MRQTVTPYLLYEDAGAAIEWLSKAFGFGEKDRFEHEGRVAHAELDVGDGSTIFLGGPGGVYRNPKAVVLAGAALLGRGAVERLRRPSPVEPPEWLSLYRDGG